jgi:hypothetical protein
LLATQAIRQLQNTSTAVLTKSNRLQPNIRLLRKQLNHKERQQQQPTTQNKPAKTRLSKRGLINS